MIQAKDLYPDIDEATLSGNYQPIINSFGEVLIQVDECNYQGDSYILYKADNGYKFLTFGWGSCSGCDALQACSDYGDIDNLITSLESQIKKFNNFQEVLEFVNADRRDLEWYGSENTWKVFVENVNNLKGEN